MPLGTTLGWQDVAREILSSRDALEQRFGVLSLQRPKRM